MVKNRTKFQWKARENFNICHYECSLQFNEEKIWKNETNHNIFSMQIAMLMERTEKSTNSMEMRIRLWFAGTAHYSFNLIISQFYTIKNCVYFYSQYIVFAALFWPPTRFSHCICEFPHLPLLFCIFICVCVRICVLCLYDNFVLSFLVEALCFPCSAFRFGFISLFLLMSSIWKWMRKCARASYYFHESISLWQSTPCLCLHLIRVFFFLVTLSLYTILFLFCVEGCLCFYTNNFLIFVAHFIHYFRDAIGKKCTDFSCYSCYCCCCFSVAANSFCVFVVFTG